MLGPVEFTRLLADRTRLIVLGALAAAPRTLDELSEHTGVPRRRLLSTLSRLQAAGLVHMRDERLTLDDRALSELVRSLPGTDPPSAALLSVLDPADAEIAARFFSGRALSEIPAQESKRRVVLRVIAEEFEPGRYYGESEVTRILQRFHGDHAALRRYLVEAGLLARENATRTYWRGGGPGPTRPVPSQP